MVPVSLNYLLLVSSIQYAFIALTLLVMHQEERSACKNWVMRWSVYHFWWQLTQVVLEN